MLPNRVQDDQKFSPRSLRIYWSAWWANSGPIWRFGLMFGALMGLFYLLILAPVFDRMLYSYLEANAWLANGILNGLGQETHVSEITIRAARYAITVRRGCDAVEPSWFFCAALLSFPAPFTRKLVGIIVGALLLQALNLIRIVSLFFIGLHRPQFFNTAHVEIWPAVFIVVAISLWIGWISWTRGPGRVTPHAAA